MGSRSAKRHDIGNMRESIGADRVTGEMRPVGPSPATIPLPPEEDRVEWTKEVVKEIPLSKVRPDPGQPRKRFDAEELEVLSRTLARCGQLSPAAVYPDPDSPGGYLLVFGERRWRAMQLPPAKEAGRKKLRCIVYPARPSDEDVVIRQFVENEARADLAPMEKAAAIRGMMERFGWTQREVCDQVGVTQATVSRHLALLDLPEPVRELVAEGRLAATTAAEIARLDDPAGQVALAGRAAAGLLNRAEVMEAIRAVKAVAAPARPINVDLIRCESNEPLCEAPPTETEVVVPPPNRAREADPPAPPEIAPESRPGAIPAPEPSPAERASEAPVKPSKRAKEAPILSLNLGDWGLIELHGDNDRRCPPEESELALVTLGKWLTRVGLNPGVPGFYPGERVRVRWPHHFLDGAEATVVGHRDDGMPRMVTIAARPEGRDSLVTAVDMDRLTLLPPIGEVDEPIRGHLNHGSPTATSPAIRGRFRDALARANVATLRQALQDLDGLPGKATAVEAIEARLRRLEGGHR